MSTVPGRGREILRLLLLQVLVLVLVVAFSFDASAPGAEMVHAGLAATFVACLALLVLLSLRTPALVRGATVLFVLFGLATAILRRHWLVGGAALAAVLAGHVLRRRLGAPSPPVPEPPSVASQEGGAADQP